MHSADATLGNHLQYVSLNRYLAANWISICFCVYKFCNIRYALPAPKLLSQSFTKECLQIGCTWACLSWKSNTSHLLLFSGFWFIRFHPIGVTGCPFFRCALPASWMTLSAWNLNVPTYRWKDRYILNHELTIIQLTDFYSCLHLLLHCNLI